MTGLTFPAERLDGVVASQTGVFLPCFGRIGRLAHCLHQGAFSNALSENVNTAGLKC